jgi:hypothetical protein
LVEESIRRFGSTKRISFLINEKLRKTEVESTEKIVEKTFGLWKDWKISSEKYVKKIRESERRLERLGI